MSVTTRKVVTPPVNGYAVTETATLTWHVSQEDLDEYKRLHGKIVTAQEWVRVTRTSAEADSINGHGDLKTHTHIVKAGSERIVRTHNI